MSRVRISTEELKALEALDDDEVAAKDRAGRKAGFVAAAAALQEEAANKVESDAAVYIPPVPLPVLLAPERPAALRTTEPSVRGFRKPAGASRLPIAVFVLACACLAALLWTIRGEGEVRTAPSSAAPTASVTAPQVASAARPPPVLVTPIAPATPAATQPPPPTAAPDAAKPPRAASAVPKPRPSAPSVPPSGLPSEILP